MPNDDKSGKVDPITGLRGLPATVAKLGMAGMVLLMLAWKIMVNDPDERRAGREHANRSVDQIRAGMDRQADAIDRQTQTFIDVQSETHRNQKLLIEAQNRK